MIKRSFLFLITVLTACVGVNSCIRANESLEPVAVFLNDNEISLEVGENATLKVSVVPNLAEPDQLVWHSTDEDVVVVSDGILSALSEGTSNVIVSCGTCADTCLVSVYGTSVSEVSFSINVKTVALLEGESFDLNVHPMSEVEESELEWSSSNEEVASVNADGVVTASELGECVISATYKGKKEECKIFVLDKPNIGDYYYDDGSWSESLMVQKKVAGVVFWIGNPCSDDKTLQKDHPNCVHGLVVSHCGDESSSWQEAWMAYDTTVGSWLNNNYPDYHDIVCPMEDENTNRNKIMGYNNTKAIKAFNESRDNVWWPVNAIWKLDEFAQENPSPDATSGWYIPSIKELSILSFGDYEGDIANTYPGVSPTVYELICDKLSNIEGADMLETSDPYAETGYYWSSTEQNKVFVYDMPLDKGYVTSATKTSSKVHLRYILAF